MTIERRTGANAKHGLALTPEYRAWVGMRARCLDPDHPAYARYGGRGIKVCDRWLESVDAFIQDMGPRPSDDYEIDRYPNNDGNYEPGNCRWATRVENDRNRRSNRLIEHAGETLTLAAWSERTGIHSTVISRRIARGWTVESALTTPAREKSAAGTTKSRTPCIDCAEPAQGLRCRKCEDIRRGANE